MQPKLRTFALAGLLTASAPLAAGPSGAQVADTCARALAGGYRGMHAGMCDWYVAPCATCGAPAGPPRWCAGADVDRASLARVVVEGMAARADAGTRAADELVAEILARAYPCPAP